MANSKKQKEAKPGWEVALLLFVGALAFSRGKSSGGEGNTSGTSSSAKNHIITEQDLASAFDKIALKYGNSFAKEIEQLYRKETAHFTSGQFLKSFTPGMEISPGKNLFPFGWGSLNEFISVYQPKLEASDFYLVPMKENKTGIIKNYIGFPDLQSAVSFVAYTLKKRVHPGYWRSTKPDIADAYRTSYKQITTKYVIS